MAYQAMRRQPAAEIGYFWWLPDVSMVEPLHTAWLHQLTTAGDLHDLRLKARTRADRRTVQASTWRQPISCHVATCQVRSSIETLHAILGFDTKFRRVAWHSKTCTPNRFALHAVKTDARAHLMNLHVPRPKR